MQVAQVLVNKIYMKYLVVLFLSLYSFIKADAQVNKTDALEINLSTSEFKTLKSDYSKMLESSTYDQLRKSHRNINKKMNGIDYPDSKEDRKWMVDSLYTKRWLSKNIAKTKFSSVNEAYSCFKKLLDLTLKQMYDNKDMYVAMVKANKTQLKELFDMEYNWNKARMLE